MGTRCGHQKNAKTFRKDQLGEEKIKGHFIARARSSPEMQESKAKLSERYQRGTDYAVTTKEPGKKGGGDGSQSPPQRQSESLASNQPRLKQRHLSGGRGVQVLLEHTLYLCFFYFVAILHSFPRPDGRGEKDRADCCYSQSFPGHPFQLGGNGTATSVINVWVRSSNTRGTTYSLFSRRRGYFS